MATKKEMLKHEQWVRQIVREEIDAWWQKMGEESARNIQKRIKEGTWGFPWPFRTHKPNSPITGKP
jgi:hypothetical protein